MKLTYIAILLGQLFIGSALIAAEAPSLRGVHNALGGTMTPLFVAQDLGLFAKHGLQHSLNYLPATSAVQAPAAGSEEIGFVGNQCVDVGIEGADTVYVAATASRFIFQLSQSLYRSDLDYPARQGSRAQDHGQTHEDGQSPVGRGGL
jgi:ABC-type nitrate/sulfonate/bicarbonate transport system substrate-binding protein